MGNRQLTAGSRPPRLTVRPSPDGKRRWREFPLAQLGVVTLLAVPILWPLLRGQVFCTHDGNLHFYRLVAIRDAIDRGLVFSRWIPGLVYGYGFPFFNYRELLSYYLPEAVHLAGLSIPAALNAVYAAGLVVSGWGSYLLARDIWRDDRAALVAAVAYMAAPYQMLDLYVRGNLPECMALALLPWILWLFWRSALAPGRLTFCAAAFSLAALLLTHNISSLLFVPLLAAYLVFLLSLEPGHQRPVIRWAAVAAPLLLGIALATFAWLPAMAERDSVQLYLTYSTRGNDFHHNFISLAELLAPPAPSDPTLLNPPLRVQLGLPQLALALAGLCGAVRFRDAHRRRHVVFLALAAAGLALLALPLAEPLWEALPLIRYVQFPWRLVGRAALPLALMAGAPLALLPRRIGWPACAAAALLLLAALPSLYPPDCSYPPSPDLADVMDYERRTGLAGVDPLGAYLPRWVAERPSGSPMEAALREGATPLRFDAGRLAPGAVVLQQWVGPNRATLDLQTPAAFQALYHAFYFPGWVAWVDGRRVPLEPSPETGLITFWVPPGRHTVTIRWELTVSRAVAAAVSLAALVALALAAGVAKWRFPGGQDPAAALPEPGSACRSDRSRLGPVLAALSITALALLAFKLLLVDGGYTPLRRPRFAEGTVPGLQQAAPDGARDFDDGLRLLGFRLEPAPAGSEFLVDLAWTASRAPAGSYQSRVALVDADGRTWSEKETFRPRGYQPHPPTTQWQPGLWVWDSHSVPILPGTPPGVYSLQLTVFDRATLAPLSALDSAGNVVAPYAIIGRLQVDRPPAPGAGISMQYRLDRRFGDLTLLGANLDRSEAAPGDPALVTLFWRAEAQLPPLTAWLELVDPDGETVGSWSLALIRDDYPPAAWRVGDELMGQHLLQIPGRAGDGRHVWRLTVLNAAGLSLPTPVSLGAVVIRAPERTWTAPPVAHPADVQYSLPSGALLARLVGYDLASTGDRIELVLVWQAAAETETSYRVFAHLLAADGRPIAQTDGIPAGWTRPTSGWAPGEFIIDSHSLLLPADLSGGEYALAVGLYQMPSGGRLAATQDRLTTVRVP